MYAVYHVLRAALALDALCCALALQVPTLPLHPNPSPNPNPNLKPNATLTLTVSLALQFHLSYWSIEGWPHDGAGTGGTISPHICPIPNPNPNPNPQPSTFNP